MLILLPFLDRGYFSHSNMDMEISFRLTGGDTLNDGVAEGCRSKERMTGWTF